MAWAAPLAFREPASSRLSGLVELEVIAPHGTTAVRYLVDDVRVSEMTDQYAKSTGSAPEWRTATDAGWLSPGRHLLRAEADTPGGVMSVEKPIVTERPAAPRGVFPLNGAWEFAPSTDLADGALDGDRPAAAQPDYDRGKWWTVLVPGTLGAIKKEWNDYAGLIGVYRRSVTLAAPKDGERTALHFASIYWDGRVFVNGREAGRASGGYTPHRFDVTDLVHPGENHIAVIVDHRQETIYERTAYWNFGGILQEVFLERTPPVALLELRAEGDADGNLTLRPYGVNATGSSQAIEATVDVVEPDGRAIINAQPVRITLNADGEAEPLTLAVPSPKLWDWQRPNRYTVRLTPTGLHAFRPLTERTGFRTVAVRDGDILLNGKPLRNLQGFNRHVDYPGLGRTEVPGIARRELEMLRKKGFRIFRPGHYPTTPAVLDAADALGLLVLEEINVHFLPGAELSSERIKDFAAGQLRRAVRRDRSHPSLIAWSIGNENGTDSEEAIPYIRDTVSLGRSLDPNRLFTHVSNKYARDVTYNHLDFVGMNAYAGWYTNRNKTRLGEDPVTSILKTLEQTQERAGGKPVLITEYGAEAVAGRQGTDKGSEYYQAWVVDEHNRLLRNRPGLVGKMYWTSTEFWCQPDWSGGNPDPVPPFHVKALLTHTRKPKLAWRVMFAPFSMRAATVDVPPGQDVARTVDVDVISTSGFPTSGRMVLSPPPGFQVENPAVPFYTNASEPSGILFTLRGLLDVDQATGLVRAIHDEGSEALPLILTVQRADTAEKSPVEQDGAIKDFGVVNGDFTLLVTSGSSETPTGRATITDAEGGSISAAIYTEADARGARWELRRPPNSNVSSTSVPITSGAIRARLLRRGTQVVAEYAECEGPWRSLGSETMAGPLTVRGEAGPDGPRVSLWLSGRVEAAGVRADPLVMQGQTSMVDVSVSNATDRTASVTLSIDGPRWGGAAVSEEVAPFSEATISIPVHPASGPPDMLAIAPRITWDGKVVETPSSAPVAVVPPAESLVLPLDAGNEDSPVLAGYTRLSPTDAWDAARGFGWVGKPPIGREREAKDDLRRDFVMDTEPRILRVHVPAGEHRAHLLVGDASYRAGVTAIEVDGKRVAGTERTLNAGEYRWLSFDLDGGPAGRAMDLTIRGGGEDNWRLCAFLLK